MTELCDLFKTPVQKAEKIFPTLRNMEGWTLEECKEILDIYFMDYKIFFEKEHPPIKEKDLRGVLRGLPRVNGRSMWAKCSLVPAIYPPLIEYFMRTHPEEECNILNFMHKENRLAPFADIP